MNLHGLRRCGLVSAGALVLAACAGPLSPGGSSAGYGEVVVALASPSCTNPRHTFELNPSNPQDGLTLEGYYVSNGTWNQEYQYSQTLKICSYKNWYAVATIDDDSKEVKSYPNVHKDFASRPSISSFGTITSDFAGAGPGIGIYDFAYDVWLNGIADDDSTEVMIWTDNHGQKPSGSVQGEFTSNGRTYTVWRNASYIAFVDTSNTAAGTVNLLDFFTYITSRGWIPAASTIGQIDYGVEIVSTDGSPATFSVSDFSLNAH